MIDGRVEAGQADGRTGGIGEQAQRGGAREPRLADPAWPSK